MTENNGLKVTIAIICILAAVCSFLMTDRLASPEFHTGTIQSLEQKNRTVRELAAASAVASAGITLLPGDTATPIADKLAEFSSYFLIVVSAIYLEKYLTTITAYAAFRILIPAAFILWAIYAFAKREAIRRLASKLMVFGLAIVLVIPASVKVSDMIDDLYSESINSTVSAALESSETLPSGAESTDETGGLGLFNGVRETITGTGDHIKQVLNNFVEALAVMIVTSCLIPILVMMFFVWLVKIILGTDLQWLMNTSHQPRRDRKSPPES